MRRTLTADDIKAMRMADSFYVWLDGTDAEMALKKRERRPKPRDPFQAPTAEGERRVLCNIGSTATGSAGGYYAPAALRALALIVRPGDALLFAFRENGNGYLRAAIIPAGALDSGEGYDRLHADELLATVVRIGKDGRERHVIEDLIMLHSVCPDNSARMQRPVAKIPSRA